MEEGGLKEWNRGREKKWKGKQKELRKMERKIKGEKGNGKENRGS